MLSGRKIIETENYINYENQSKVRPRKTCRSGLLTVEAALVIPVMIGVIVLLYSLALIEYQNTVARTEAMRTANRAAMNWNTIGTAYEHTIFHEDSKPAVFSGETSTETGKTGKNIITSESYAEHDPYRFFIELFTPGSTKQANMEKFLEQRMKENGEIKAGIQLELTKSEIKGDSGIHIFNRYVSVRLENSYNSPMLEFLDRMGFSVKKDYAITAKAKLTDPSDFVRIASYIQELIRKNQ